MQYEKSGRDLESELVQKQNTLGRRKKIISGGERSASSGMGLRKITLVPVW